MQDYTKKPSRFGGLILVALLLIFVYLFSSMIVITLLAGFIIALALAVFFKKTEVLFDFLGTCWEWLKINDKPVLIIVAIIGFAVAYKELKQLTFQNSLANEELKQMTFQSSLLEQSFREEFRPVGICKIATDTFSVGNVDSQRDDTVWATYSFGPIEFYLHNKGRSIFRFIGAFSYLSIDTGKDNRDFRKDMIASNIDTSKIGYDLRFDVQRGQVLIPGDSVLVKVKCREIDYRPSPWLYQYIIIYTDYSNKLYDTIYINGLRFEHHVLPDSLIKPENYFSETFHAYSYEEKEAMKSYHDLTGHPLFSYIE